nr:MAG TPA: hypothetical protein [Caudoviricetes sp.]
MIYSSCTGYNVKFESISIVFTFVQIFRVQHLENLINTDVFIFKI